jgi:hypothetical protein
LIPISQSNCHLVAQSTRTSGSKEKDHHPYPSTGIHPAALGASGIAFLKTQLEALVLDGLSFNDIVTKGKVTRLDIAVDIVGVHLADLIVSIKSGGKHHWYYSAEGKPETGYHGMKKSDKNAKWITYNKRQQVKDSPEPPAEQAYGGLSHTRIEYRALKSPLTQISLAYPQAPKGVKTYEWSFFIDSCARRGQAAALEMLPEGKLRESYQKSLDAAQTTFWRPNRIWEAWPDALLNSGIVQK